MNRIYKNYNFHLSNAATANYRMSFSSYPGFLSSLDDFYMMADSKLVMVQTTNNVFNTSLYDAVKPQSLLAWQRVRVANTMSKSGRDWYNYVSAYNSGTYNNQYMIVNMGLFKPGTALPSDLLWVIEQIPTYVAGGDVTQQLERGYWVSGCWAGERAAAVNLSLNCPPPPPPPPCLASLAFLQRAILARDL